MDLTSRLENFVRNGGLTNGLQLKRCNLTGLNLVNHGSKQGFDLSESDLYRACLKDAHLFNLKLQNGSLMKADLRNASLHCADLRGTNLLGARLSEATLENLQIGEHILQEHQARECAKCSDKMGEMDNLEQAEEIYRNFRKHADTQGLYNLAGVCSYKELLMRRKRMPKWSSRWIFSHFIDWLCGYGEKPENTVMFAITLIFISAIGYAFFGINYDGQTLMLSADLGVYANLSTFFLSLYYSLVTFTTLGYGDVTPIGFSRALAAIEAFLGTFSIALFVVVFVRKMAR